MAEAKAATAPDLSTITGAGAPVRVAKGEEKVDTATAKAETKTDPLPAAAADSVKDKQVDDVKLPEVNDEQLKELLKGKGISFENFDELKTKLTTPAAPVELTAEQKAESEKALDKRMLDHFIETGGTAEQFVALKQIAAMDLKELSVASIKKSMKEDGFSQDQIDAILKERYYQINPDELEKENDEESDEDFNKRKEFIKKKVGFGSKKLENHGLPIKKDAEETLKSLRQEIESKDAADRKEKEFSSKVDEFSKTVPRKITLELGEVNQTKQAPVEYNVSEEDIAEVTNILRDKASRESHLFNKDGTLDLQKVFGMMLANKALATAAKASFIEGGNRQVEEIRKTFPGSPYDLGVGGSKGASEKGKAGVGGIVSAGKPERVRQNN